MALGALTLPSVSTGFTSDSKSMVPVSIQGMADKVTKMSPLESMQEVFFDIRDGIGNLGEIFREKISGLNDHLAFRLESLNKTMSNIGNVAAKDLGFEKKTFDIIKDNEAEDERDESLGKDGKKFNGLEFLKTIQERFNGLLDLLAPKSEIGKVGLLGALTLGIIALLPKLEKSLEGVFEFTGEKLIPFLDSIFDIKDDETGEFKWDRVLGVGLLAYLTAKSLPVIGAFALKKLFTVPGGLKVAGLVGLATWATASIFQTIGDWTRAKDWSADVGATDNETLNKISGALAGDLKGGIMNAFKNASKFAGIGAFTGFMIGGPPGALIGGVIGAAVGGILGWIGGGQLAQSAESLINGVKGIWNSVTTGIRNFFYDYEVDVEGGPPGQTTTQRSQMGKVIDRFKADFKLMGEGLADFFYDDQGNLFGINFGALKNILPTIKEIAQSILDALPDWAQPLTEAQKQQKSDVKSLQDKDFFDKDLAGYSEITRSKIGDATADELKSLLDREGDDLRPNDIEFIKNAIRQKEEANIVLSQGMKEKTTEIKRQELIRTETGAPAMVTIAPINNSKGGDTYQSTSYTTTSLGVDGKNPQVKALEDLMSSAAG